MSKRLEVGKAINAILQPIVGVNKVFALVAPPNTPMPHIVYKRNAFDDKYWDKCASSRSAVSVIVEVRTSKYPEGITIARDIIDSVSSLDLSKAYGGIIIEDLEVVDTTEDVSEDGNIFMQRLEIMIEL